MKAEEWGPSDLRMGLRGERPGPGPLLGGRSAQYCQLFILHTHRDAHNCLPNDLHLQTTLNTASPQ